MGKITVIITHGYWLGVYPVTQCQWEAVMGTNPSHFKGKNLPVESVSWEGALDFCVRLDVNQLSIPEGYIFSLPTEAQWEYACKAGSGHKYQLGDSLADLSRVAWHRENNTGFATQIVGQKEPNNWGLYDTLGNVMEWCTDNPVDYPDGTTQIDRVAGIEDTTWGKYDHILRGGCVFNPPSEHTLTCFGRMYGDVASWFTGFRLCLRYQENRSAS